MPIIQVREIRTVGVPVTDQDRAVEFYVEVLGFEKQMDVPIGGGNRWIVVGAPRGTTTIALVAASDRLPTGVQTGVRLISSDIDGDHASLGANGVPVDEVLRWPGVPPMFSFRDGDGNVLELVGEFEA